MKFFMNGFIIEFLDVAQRVSVLSQREKPVPLGVHCEGAVTRLLDSNGGLFESGDRFL